MKKKTGNWIYKNGLLCISILVFLILFFVVLYCPKFNVWIKTNLHLEIYHAFIILGAILTLFWTNKRQKQAEKQYKHSQKQYKQTEDSIFKNKANTIYLEVIKLLSDKETKEKPIVVNLINSIQASIKTHYQSKKERKDAQATILDFQGMDLEDANLRGANLEGANLTNADLENTKLIFAKLIGAKLIDANLSGANLERAFLTNADLTGADLTGADLTGANLTGAKLKGAKLKGAKLKGAWFKDAKDIPNWIKAKLDDKFIYRE